MATVIQLRAGRLHRTFDTGNDADRRIIVIEDHEGALDFWECYGDNTLADEPQETQDALSHYLATAGCDRCEGRYPAPGPISYRAHGDGWDGLCPACKDAQD